MKCILISYVYQKRYVTLDMGYISAYAKKCGADVEFDKILIRKDTNLQKLTSEIMKKDAKMVVFLLDNIQSSYYFALKPALKLFWKLKDITKVMHSNYLTAQYAKSIMQNNDNVDIIIFDEPEEPLSMITKGNSLSKIPGIAYRNPQITLNPPCSPIEPLDELPSPYLENEVDIDWVKRHKFAMLTTSRGCNFQCPYCARGNRTPKTRYFSVQRFLDEIQYLESLDVKAVNILDDSFISSQVRLDSMVSGMSSFRIRFQLMSRPEFLTAETIRLLKKMNTRIIQIGLQTTNKEVLKWMNRHYEPVDFKKKIKLLNQNGIRIMVDLILGLPGDDLGSFKKSVDFLAAQDIYRIRVMRLFAPIGSRVHYEHGIIFDRMQEHHGKIQYSRDFSSKDIRDSLEYCRRFNNVIVEV